MKILIVMLLSVSMLFVAAGQVISRAGKEDKMETLKNDRPAETRSAVFAGGCFWCTESDFEHVDGVLDVIAGYTGGQAADPTYEQVSSGSSGHVEAVKVIYDPRRISYSDLLDIFWRHVNPTDAGGQFVDRGDQYRSVIFYADEEQKASAEQSRDRLTKTGPFNEPIVTEILPLGPFYEAEEYHQNYYEKNPIRYRWYRAGSGRDQFLQKTWSAMQHRMQADATTKADAPDANSADYVRPADEELRKRLTPQQYAVTRKDATEPAFNNEYWDNHEPGIYVDVVSGEPLFSSTHKFDSGTGWPSFTQPLQPDNIVEKEDRSWLTVRTEVRSRQADSHLGHVFKDGPPPTGLRYCINSAALRFIPQSELKQHGLDRYHSLLE